MKLCKRNHLSTVKAYLSLISTGQLLYLGLNCAGQRSSCWWAQPAALPGVELCWAEVQLLQSTGKLLYLGLNCAGQRSSCCRVQASCSTWGWTVLGRGPAAAEYRPAALPGVELCWAEVQLLVSIGQLFYLGLNCAGQRSSCWWVHASCSTCGWTVLGRGPAAGEYRPAALPGVELCWAEVQLLVSTCQLLYLGLNCAGQRSSCLLAQESSQSLFRVSDPTS